MELYCTIKELSKATTFYFWWAFEKSDQGYPAGRALDLLCLTTNKMKHINVTSKYFI